MIYQPCIWCGEMVTTCTMSRCITNGFVHLVSRKHSCRTERWSSMFALPRYPRLLREQVNTVSKSEHTQSALA